MWLFLPDQLFIESAIQSGFHELEILVPLLQMHFLKHTLLSVVELPPFWTDLNCPDLCWWMMLKEFGSPIEFTVDELNAIKIHDDQCKPALISEGG